MSPLDDSTSYRKTATGSIDYAYYDRQARINRSKAFRASLIAFGKIFRRPQLRLSIPAPLIGNGPAASPCS